MNFEKDRNKQISKNMTTRIPEAQIGWVGGVVVRALKACLESSVYLLMKSIMFKGIGGSRG